MEGKSDKIYEIQNKDWELIETLIYPSGQLTELILRYWESIEEEALKFFFSLMCVGKIRRNEYFLVKTLTRIKGEIHLVLENGLKKSRKQRQIANIEPFYSFITERLGRAKELIEEAKTKYFFNQDDVKKYFKNTLKPVLGKSVCPRSFEKLTVTYLVMNTNKGNKSISQVTGHKSPKNVESYIASPELSASNIIKGLEGEFSKIATQNLIIANDLNQRTTEKIREIEEYCKDLKNNQEALNNKLDLILSILKP